MVASIVPCVIRIDTEQGELLVAVDEGLMRKSGAVLDCAVRQAVTGTSMDDLEKMIADTFGKIDDEEARVRSIVARLEKDIADVFEPETRP